MKVDKTLAGEWIRIRTARGLSQRDIGRNCDLSHVTPWKAENGRPLRWETLHLMLKDGMKVLPGSPDYELIHRLWMDERKIRAESQAPDHAKRTAEKPVRDAVTKFRKIIKYMSEEELDRFMTKVERLKV